MSTKVPGKVFGVATMYGCLTRDTFNGKKFNSAGLYMRVHSGELTVTVDNVEHVIGVSACLDGSTHLDYNGRTVKVSLRKLVEEAIANGLLEKTIDFKELV